MIEVQAEDLGGSQQGRARRYSPRHAILDDYLNTGGVLTRNRRYRLGLLVRALQRPIHSFACRATHCAQSSPEDPIGQTPFHSITLPRDQMARNVPIGMQYAELRGGETIARVRHRGCRRYALGKGYTEAMASATVGDLSDNDLVALVRASDDTAFDELVRRHSARVYGLALGMMRNPSDAQDIVQDTFLNAYRKIDSFRGDAAFSSWLYRIAHNACLMKMRSRRRRPEVPLEFQTNDDDAPVQRHIEDFSPRLDELYEQKELGAVILRAMESLPESYRSVFVLADLQHMPMKQIAEALDLTVPNVKTRLHRARLKLRAHLADYIAAEPVASRI